MDYSKPPDFQREISVTQNTFLLLYPGFTMSLRDISLFGEGISRMMQLSWFTLRIPFVFYCRPQGKVMFFKCDYHSVHKRVGVGQNIPSRGRPPLQADPLGTVI